MKRYIYLFIVLLFCLLSFYSFSDQILLFESKNWGLIKKEEEKYCYMLSYKIDSLTNSQNERKPYIMLIKKNNRFDWLVYCDFILRPNSEISLSFKKNGKVFRFIPNGKNTSTAFLANEKESQVLLNEIKNADFIHIFSESINYQYAIDFYSIDNFNAVFEKMKTYCF